MAIVRRKLCRRSPCNNDMQRRTRQCDWAVVAQPLVPADVQRSPNEMLMTQREYQYVGPSEIRDAARCQPTGTRIDLVDQLAQWLASEPTERTPHQCWVATFTINMDGALAIAPRRSEHVACAAGGPVLSAGEITFDDDMTVAEITNQSTGFCPEPESWPAVSDALDRAGIKHPERFTTEVIFRRCPKCGERNIVKDSWYYCGICNAKLPTDWNFSCHTEVGEQ